MRLLALFEEPFELHGYRIPTTVSIGIAYSDSGDVDPDQMIRQADLALYNAKAAGRGTFCFHDKAMDHDVHERLQLSHELREAIDKNELFLSLQPQLDLTSGRISGFEALVRWNHPEQGILPPRKFVPIAESSGMIIEIGEWVMHEACRSLSMLRIKGNGDLYVSVNVSPVELRLPDFADKLLCTLEREGLPPAALELELSERVLMNKTQPLQRALSALHQAGVRFSVDDFGTACSSMLYLRQFSVDKLKIAGSLLRNIETDTSNAGIVSALISLGHTLGLTVLAKGVERKAQLNFLRENGCAEAQGYLFSPPVSLSEFLHLLDSCRDATLPLPG